jgi:hypothetical protein
MATAMVPSSMSSSPLHLGSWNAWKHPKKLLKMWDCPLDSNSQTLTDLDVVQAMEWACSGWLWPRKFGFETGLFVHVLETV